jgi:hypothetical protein
MHAHCPFLDIVILRSKTLVKIGRRKMTAVGGRVGGFHNDNAKPTRSPLWILEDFSHASSLLCQ